MTTLENTQIILDLLVGRKVTGVEFDGKILKIRIPEGLITLAPSFSQGHLIAETYNGHVGFFMEDLRLTVDRIEKLVYADNSPDRPEDNRKLLEAINKE